MQICYYWFILSTINISASQGIMDEEHGGIGGIGRLPLTGDLISRYHDSD